MLQVWARGSKFRVEKPPNSLYQRDSVFIGCNLLYETSILITKM
jgi:hypothetical protein